MSAVAIIGYCAFLAGPPLLGFLGEQFGILNALLVILVLIVLAGARRPGAPASAPSPRRASTRAPPPASVRGSMSASTPRRGAR